MEIYHVTPSEDPGVLYTAAARASNPDSAEHLRQRADAAARRALAARIAPLAAASAALHGWSEAHAARRIEAAVHRHGPSFLDAAEDRVIGIGRRLAGTGAAPDRAGRDGHPSPGPTSPAIVPAGGERRAPAEPRKALQRVRPAETTWENLRRLLCARCGLWERLTGEDADDLRHAAAAFASGGRTESSRGLSDDEMGQAVSWVEDLLNRAGLEAEIQQADRDYDQRRARRDAACLLEDRAPEDQTRAAA